MKESVKAIQSYLEIAQKAYNEFIPYYDKSYCVENIKIGKIKPVIEHIHEIEEELESNSYAFNTNFNFVKTLYQCTNNNNEKLLGEINDLDNKMNKKVNNVTDAIKFIKQLIIDKFNSLKTDTKLYVEDAAMQELYDYQVYYELEVDPLSPSFIDNLHTLLTHENFYFSDIVIIKAYHYICKSIKQEEEEQKNKR